MGDGILMGHKGKGAVTLSEKVKFIFQIRSEEITHLTISSSVKAIRESVGGKAIDLPHLTELSFADGLTEIPIDAFASHMELKRVELPTTMKKIRDNAFNNCPLLEEISSYCNLFKKK